MARRCKNKCGAELKPAAKCTDIIEKKGFCSAKCLVEHVRAKDKAAIAKKEAKKHKEAKERVKRTSDVKKEAQAAFNAKIRFRDRHKECASCDRTFEEIEGNDGWKVGGAWDCGHYLTVGAHEELRFHDLNAHRQCKSCNGGSGKYTKKERTVHDTYRRKLIERIGIEAVEWLEGPHEQKHYRIEDYRRIRDENRAELREMKKQARLDGEIVE